MTAATARKKTAKKTTKKATAKKASKKATKKTAASKGRPAGHSANGQGLIEGTFDPVPRSMMALSKRYLKAREARLSSQSKEDKYREQLVEAMKKGKVGAIPIDDKKCLVFEEATADSVKIKKTEELKKKKAKKKS